MKLSGPGFYFSFMLWKKIFSYKFSIFNNIALSRVSVCFDMLHF